ncbi:MAG: xanthine phosphoribosyltransferase [Firmicutes bacterium]|nr:xanthine phosphoribosyltransferase [Bacillota bacterium]
MKALKEKIRQEGSVIGTEIVKVDSFLNHQIDVEFLEEIGLEFSKRFSGVKVDRIMTVEASGIAIACLTAPYFGYPPVVFAKKAAPSTMNAGFYEAEAKSFTKGTVSVLKIAKDYIKEGENVLILDDFLASGQASLAMADLIAQAGAHVAGVGAVIEKGYQGGSQLLRDMGFQVESLAVINEVCDGKIYFDSDRG